MAEKIKIGGELEAVTQDGKLADAAQVVDSTQNKTQELINSEVKEKLDAVINTDGSVKIPTITLSGDVTGSGTTAISGTIANSAVTTAKIANSAVTNAKLANSSVTIGNKSVSLGGALTDIDTSGTLTASTIKKSGGTSAQFLKADGSVDSNSYATTSAIPTKVSALTNDAGYLTTHQDISGKVDKVSGKGLSTNDYTDAEKEKVDGAFQTSNIITSSGQTPTTDKVFSSKVINDLVSSNYTTLNNAINQKADKTALPSAASATTAGLAKLYTSTGTNADGAMTQAAATTALGNKVDKESGKGLSTNDYTTAEKNKLSGIADNANNYTLPTASGSVLGGVKVGEGLSISNGVLNVSQDTDTRILYHAAQAPSSIATTYTGTYYVLADKNIAGNTTAAVIAYYSNGTAVNELTISAGEVRQCADGTRWQASGTGWTQIKSGVNVVQTTGTSTEDVMSQKAVTDELAKKVDLTGTQTISGTKAFTGASTFTGGTKNAVVNITSVNASRDYAHLFVSSNNSTSVTRPLILQKGYGNVAIGDSIAPSHKLEVAGTFQATGAATFSSSVTANSFVKSNGTSSQFLKADGSVDSSTYLTTHQDISGKVDKVDGKGLSTNDYTTDEKTKLANIEAAANRTVVDSAISSTSTNPVTSKAISTALASKVDAVSGKSLSTNDYTTAEKTKLAGIAEGANKTTVDTALSATSTNPVTNKAVTEALAEKADASSYVKLVLKGVAEAYYANASSIPSSAADGNYICDTGSSSTIKRCITIRAGGAVVNDVTATNGDFWLSKADGHVYAAVSNNTTSWVDCGKLQGEKGDKGDKGADGADGIDGAQTVVQTTGTSTTDVMSQAAVTNALKTAGKAPEPFIWQPWKDLSHYDITAIDHTAGTITLSTEDHDIAVGDTVALSAKMKEWSNPWYDGKGNTWETFLSSTSLRNFPLKSKGATMRLKVTAVDGAVITSTDAVVTTTYTYNYSYWQLQKIPTGRVFVELPDYYKGVALSIRLQTQGYAANGFCLANVSEILRKNDTWKSQVVPGFGGDQVCGLPFIDCEFSVRNGQQSYIDYGVNLYGEPVGIGSATHKFALCNSSNWSLADSYYLQSSSMHAHYYCTYVVMPYHTLQPINPLHPQIYS